MRSRRATGETAARLVAASGLMALAGCSTPAPSQDAPTQAAPTARAASYGEVNPRLLRRFKPVRAEGFGAPSRPAVVELGRTLFHDPRLSADSTIACTSCHDVTRHGADGRATSVGIHGKRGKRNAPTVFNAAGAFTQFWDGRASNVEEQAKEVILNPDEMGMPSGDELVARLAAVPGYVAMFRTAFPEASTPLTFDTIAEAIGAYERRLVTHGSWDRYLEGDKEALTAAEREGLRTFLNVGCMVCHTGPLLGGASFERAGVVEPWLNQDDQGRSKVTGSPADRMMFKVPSLRNVASTAPYFHDGSAETLEQAVGMMGRHQLGVDLTTEEIASITTWLRALGGTVSPELTARPILPR